MKYFGRKWLINLEKCILWQYDKATSLSRIILNKQNWYKQNVTDFIVSFFIDVFNLKTANDFGLNIWGKLLNFPRQIMLNKYQIYTSVSESDITDVSVDRVTFNTKIGSGDDFVATTVTQNTKYTFIFTYNGSSWDLSGDFSASGINIANYGITYTGTIVTDDSITVVADYTPLNLSTEQYRFLLLGQILKFKMNCTIPEVNRYLRLIFNEQNNKNVYVIDNHDMTISYNIEPSSLSDEIKLLIENYDFLPAPAGVKINTGIGSYFTLKINPSPSNANVTFKINGESYPTVNNEITVNSGTIVDYTVSALSDGFQTKTGSIEVTENTTVPVTLETTLTITATPNTANISLTLNGTTYTATGSITKTVTYGNTYSYEISQQGYYTQISTGNTITGITNIAVQLQESDINLVFDKLHKENGGVESKGTFVIGQAGTYHIELGGDTGYDEDRPNTRHNGGTADITTTLEQNDEIEIKIMYGGCPDNSGYIFGGVGVGLWVNGVCKLVAGGGGVSGAYVVHSCGGGGYEGGYAYYKNRYAWNGYSINGTTGNYQNTEAGAGEYTQSTYGKAYGGSGYKADDYSSATLVYAGNTGAGYAKITYIED